MNSLSKKLELLANLAIIAVVFMLGAVLIKQYLLPRPTTAVASNARIQPGNKLSLPGMDWNRGDKTLLLVLSTQCRFCTESAPFYQRLARELSRGGSARLVAVLPQSVGEAQKYLGEHGINVDEVRQVSPDAIGADGTPTLILLDASGSVIESWIGKLPPEKEAEVIALMLAG